MIIILAPRSDLHARAVRRELTRVSQRCEILDTAELGRGARLSRDPGCELATVWVHADGDEVDLNAARAIWDRRAEADLEHGHLDAVLHAMRARVINPQPAGPPLATSMTAAERLGLEPGSPGPTLRELRVTMAGARVFTVEPGPAGADIEPYVHLLPVDVIRKLHALMNRLGLGLASIDLLLNPEGRYFFAGLDARGDFIDIEIETGLPIAAAVAGLLANTALPAQGSSTRPR